MRIGIHFPQAEIPHDYMVIRDYLQRAETLGFSHINTPDHVLQTRTPLADSPLAANYTTEFPHHEVMTLLSFAAGVTESLELKTAILILPQRQAVLVAKQAAQLDVLSGGRLQLGVGLGWNDPEFVSLDMNFNNRARRMEEQIEVCRLLWTEQHVTYEGKWHKIDDAGLAPMPIQRPIPVWIGAFQPVAVSRAARIADGWQAMLPAPGEKSAAVFSDFQDQVKTAGRDPDSVGIEATIFSGKIDPETWAAQIQGWIDCGATQILFRPQAEFSLIEQMVGEFAEVMKDF
ncbi:MAG: LLM class F420-dependent oxidoreductase [Pseudomonadales bacterium]|nr:LLM class F420-dependent oxidoreductase [Pseudomonadales bacterium]